jgi:cell division protease FtsH
MVTDYGMSRLGRVSYRESSQSIFLAHAGADERLRTHSERTAREIDEEVRRIIEEMMENVRRILETRRGALEALTRRLIEVESIDAAELKSLVEASSPGPLIVPGTGDVSTNRTTESRGPRDAAPAETGR